MKIKDLIKQLEQFEGNTEIMILDGFNAGGYPRIINVTPMVCDISEDDADMCADCEGRVGEQIVVMGYGCY